MPDKPRRRHVLTITIGADDRRELYLAVKEVMSSLLYNHSDELPPEPINMVTGGCNSGWFALESVDPTITHDRYFEDVSKMREANRHGAD